MCNKFFSGQSVPGFRFHMDQYPPLFHKTVTSVMTVLHYHGNCCWDLLSVATTCCCIYSHTDEYIIYRLDGWLVFNSIFSINRIYHAIGIWNRTIGRNKYTIKQWNNTLNQKINTHQPGLCGDNRQSPFHD